MAPNLTDVAAGASIVYNRNGKVKIRSWSMHTRGWYGVPSMTPEQREDARDDLASIVRGEELDMPWRRLRILLDHKLVEINHPVLTQESRTSVGFTEEGLQFLELL